MLKGRPIGLKARMSKEEMINVEMVNIKKRGFEDGEE